ncbi:MAG: hypothetical protein HC902_10195 [Calothrix sp. SM1_5_4]|nr:hypothetical protein [Calothrix sp. SM1_5_4]
MVSLMKNALKPYDDLLGEAYGGDPAWQPEVREGISFGRFSTRLAEVKDSVAQVREWLEGGIDARKIAIVAPDIEEYWPALELYFRQEGIPASKPSTARLGSYLELARWMSTLRTAVSKVSSGDLEVFLFAGQAEARLSFDEFRVLFSNVYDVNDLSRARHLFEAAETTEAETAPDSARPLSVAEFLAWALKYWHSGSDTARLVSLLQVIGQEVPPALELTAAQWLGYVEGLVARRELTLRAPDETGVWCVSLSSADWLPATHAIFVNLCESALRSVENSPVSSSEGQKIFADTGYAVGTTDRQEHEFEFLWFLNREWTELRLNFAATDFQGRVLTPSRLWMWAGFTSGQLKLRPESPRFTRWDEIQKQPVDAIAGAHGFSGVRVEGLKLALARDVDASVSGWKPSREERVSASSLRKYWSCPFIFAAERRFRLSDDPVLDLDLDRRTRGNLLHAIAETLSAEPPRWDWSDGELAEIVETARARQKILLGDERLWPAVRAQHIRLARCFS